MEKADVLSVAQELFDILRKKGLTYGECGDALAATKKICYEQVCQHYESGYNAEIK